MPKANFTFIILSQNIVKRFTSRTMKWARHRGADSAYNILAGTPQQKRPFGRSRHRWQHNIKVNVGELDSKA